MFENSTTKYKYHCGYSYCLCVCVCIRFHAMYFFQALFYFTVTELVVITFFFSGEKWKLREAP